MSEFKTRLHSVPSGGFLTDRDKDKKPILDVRELDTEVVVDGNITTSYGLGGAIPFALELVRQLAGETEADRIRNAIAYRH